MKIFISQPMRGYTREAILEERARIQEIFSGNEFIDSFIEDVPEMMGNTSVWCLGESIKMMADADMVVVPYDAYRYDGCAGVSVELAVAEVYDIPICKIEMYPNDVNRCEAVCEAVSVNE